MRIFLLALLWSLGSCSLVFGDAASFRYVFFENTQYPLTVHVLEGEEAGPTILVQGGIQGDETSGYMTAELLTSAKVKKGRLIVIPRANLPSVHLRQRQVNVDMNRRFDQEYGKFYEDILARAVRYILKDCDGLIHLHEGSGFYSPTYVSGNKNPRRYGQSVIIDTEGYKGIQLGKLCRRVLADFNPAVRPQKYAFSLFNTRTIENSSPYLEQRKSLSYYALTRLKIPALAIEVSKAISDLNWKVEQQLALTLAFLREMGVEAECEVGENVRDWFNGDVVLRVNGEILENSVTLRAGTELAVQLEARNPHAIYAVFASDRPGYDLLKGSRYLIRPFKSLELYADGKKIRTIPVQWNEAESGEGQKGDFVYKLNDKTFFSSPGSIVEAREGDRLVLEGVLGSGKEEVLNVKGFVANPPGEYNGGQDIGVEIVLCREMFLSRYVKKNGENWSFRTERETPETKASPLVFNVHPYHAPAFVLTGQGEKIVVYGPRVGAIELPTGEYVFEGGWAGDASSVYCLLNGRLVQKGEKITLSENEKNRLELIDKSSFFILSDFVFRSFQNFL